MMKYLDLTFPTPAENLACDEALLECAEQPHGTELLRFWEPKQHVVVTGYANKPAVEVNLKQCHRLGIPVLRRCTGGGAVLQGPGCLNYSLILRINQSSALQNITQTNEFVMGRHAQTLAGLVRRPVTVEGH